MGLNDKKGKQRPLVDGLATEETLQSLPDKIPKYDMYITRNGDGTVATKVWKIAGTSTVVKTLTYNRSGGYLVSKIIT